MGVVALVFALILPELMPGFGASFAIILFLSGLAAVWLSSVKRRLKAVTIFLALVLAYFYVEIVYYLFY